MNKFIISLLLSFPLSSFAYLSYGDATDNCVWNTDKTLTKDIWNCDDLTVATGVTIDVATSVTTVIQLRVQGVTTIDGTIRVSATATDAGPGGSRGGDCPAAGSCSAVPGAGATVGKGNGGTAGVTTALDEGGGGGGGAGFFSAGADGVDGTGNLNAGLKGTGGNAFVTSASLSTTLQGGVGGGGGGSGQDSGGTTYPGGDGGHGSGSIVIVSKGDITLSASAIIEAKGSSGNTGGNVFGGNGGSGSGGAVYLVTKGTLTTSNAKIDITGGPANTSGANANGGKGSDGLLRVDTNSGSISGTFNLVPSVGNSVNLSTTSSTITDPNASSNTGNSGNTTSTTELESDIEASCSYKVNEQAESLPIFIFVLSFVLSMFGLSLLQLNKLRR